jgi:hypothetical protein
VAGPAPVDHPGVTPALGRATDGRRRVSLLAATGRRLDRQKNKRLPTLDRLRHGPIALGPRPRLHRNGGSARVDHDVGKHSATDHAPAASHCCLTLGSARGGRLWRPQTSENTYNDPTISRRLNKTDPHAASPPGGQNSDAVDTIDDILVSIGQAHGPVHCSP